MVTSSPSPVTRSSRRAATIVVLLMIAIIPVMVYQVRQFRAEVMEHLREL